MEPDHLAISVRRQCELLGVNRSGLYYQPLGEGAENLKLMRFIDEEYTRHPFCGSRRLMRWLHHQGYAVGRHRVRRLQSGPGSASGAAPVPAPGRRPSAAARSSPR